MNWELGYYEPLISVIDFWSYKDICVLLNSTTPEANLTLHVKPLSLLKLSMLTSFEMSNKMYAEWGIQNDMDQMKKMFSETNVWFLGLTTIVSLVHSVLEMLAFKNDIHFWKNRESV